MPQLNLDPWSYIFFFTWLALIILTPLKLLHYVSPKNPELSNQHTTHNLWIWPWQ